MIAALLMLPFALSGRRSRSAAWVGLAPEAMRQHWRDGLLKARLPE
jgi:hypothetical protein